MRARRMGPLAAVGVAVVLVAVVAASWAPGAGASSSPAQPRTVVSSVVTQSAQHIVWTLTLSSPFSPAQLKHSGQSLCLLLERPASSRVTGQLCVIPPRAGGRSPRLVYEPATHGSPGHATIVPATVTRPTTSSLTAEFEPAAYGAVKYASLDWQVRTTLRPPACTPARSNPLGCVSLYPAQPSVAPLHTPQVVGCVPSGPDYVTNGAPDDHEIALTFDDGPWSDTPQFLDILEHYDAPATFFEIGDQVAEYGRGGAVERRMLADGDMIGDHTWNHANVSAGGSLAASEISDAARAIKAATHGFEPCLFRAPYGAVSPALESEARAMGFTTIQWNDDPRDWARPGTAAIVHTAVSTAHNGSIIIQHDGGGDRSETLAALPQEIEALRHEGYKLVTVTQLLGQRLIYK